MLRIYRRPASRAVGTSALSNLTHAQRACCKFLGFVSPLKPANDLCDGVRDHSCSNIDLGQYMAALEHMSVRSGTAIPTGAAEQSLAYLYRHGKEVWPFLTHQLAITDQDTTADTPALDGSEGADISSAEGGKSETSASRADEKRREKKGGVGRSELAKDTAREDSIASNTRASCSLARLSRALEAFVRARAEKGPAPEEFSIPKLTNFLYLGGQTKVRLVCSTY